MVRELELPELSTMCTLNRCMANGVFRNLHVRRGNVLAPKVTENMHFITTKCIVILKCMYGHTQYTSVLLRYRRCILHVQIS